MKRVGTGFSRAVTPLFDIMMVHAVEEVGGLLTAVQDTPIPDAPSSSQPQRKHKIRRKERKKTEVSLIELNIEEHVPITSNDLLPSGEDSMQLKELMVLYTNLSNKVLDLENEVIYMKSSHKAKITELKSRVEKLEEGNRPLTKELKSFNTKVITTAKIIIDEVSTVGGKLNAANEEPVSVAPTNITTAQPSEATKTTVDITIAPKAKGIVIHDMVESKQEQLLQRIEAEWNADMKDNIDWNEVVEKDNAEKQKLEEQQEAKKLKRNLEIVPDDEDDVFENVTPLSSKPPTILDYKIYKEGKKEHF
uniref:Uncharacterized protein n=1 Tax=Tanacetum cinerariifolium TaxID=118510 RepID=A0A6L2JJQ4_TANCI|nr:hypothetical protein [Tanacetum cinerariifolium]